MIIDKALRYVSPLQGLLFLVHLFLQIFRGDAAKKAAEQQNICNK